MRSVAQFIQNRMDEIGITSKLAINERLGKKGRGTVHNVLSGRQLVPVRDIERWSHALELDEDQHQLFAILVNLSHASPEFERRYWAQETELGHLRSELDGLRTVVEQCIKEAKRHGLDFGNIAREVG